MVAGTDDCDKVVRVAFTLSANVLCSGLEVWVSQKECADASANGDLVLGTSTLVDLQSSRTGTFEFKIRELPVFTAADAGTCGATGLNSEHHVCGAFKAASYDCSSSPVVVKAGTSPTVTYDSQAPVAPVINTVAAADGALTVAYSASASDAVRVNLELRAAGQTEFGFFQSGAAGDNRVRLEGLQNDLAYEVRALSLDLAGNVSEPSNVVTATPLHTQGFFEVCQRSGGCGQGCAAVGGGGALAAAAALVAYRLFSRRKRR